jgi:hypothetical protein
MMATRIISREEGGIVPLGHTTARVSRPSNFVLVHYTGGSGPQPNDGRSDAQHMAALQSASINMGKTWEYNYVITYPNGWIWEMAGEFQASHCLNANGYSYGVQFNLGVGAQPNAAMFESFRWLVNDMLARGLISDESAVKHCHYTLRTTACPGNTLAEPPGPRWNSPSGEGSLGNPRTELLIPWTIGPPPPGGLFPLTDADRLELQKMFNALDLSQKEDRRNCWRAPEMGNIMRDRANEGAFDATHRQLINTPEFIAQVAAGVQQAGVNLDPAVISKAIKDALAGTAFPTVDTIAEAVADELARRAQA